MKDDELRTKLRGIPDLATAMAKGSAITEELKSIYKIPGIEHKDHQDAQALTFHSVPIKNMRASTPFEIDQIPSKPIDEILSKTDVDILDKPLIEFGNKNGYPVIFVVEAVPSQVPKNYQDGYKFKSDLKITCFKSFELHTAAKYAQKVLGTLGVFDPK